MRPPLVQLLSPQSARRQDDRVVRREQIAFCKRSEQWDSAAEFSRNDSFCGLIRAVDSDIQRLLAAVADKRDDARGE